MSGSKLLSLIYANPKTKSVIYNSIGCYLFQELLKTREDKNSLNDVKSFVECELSIYYKYAQAHKSIYSQVKHWTDLFEDLSEKIIARVGKDSFINLSNKNNVVDSLHYKYRSLLWMIANHNNYPYIDPFAISFGLSVLAAINAWAMLLMRGQAIPDILKKGSYAYAISLGLESNPIFSKLSESTKELQRLFLSFSLEKDIEIVTQVVLSRFPIVDTVQHIQQFLYEEFEAIQRVNDPSLAVQALLKKGKSFLRKHEDNVDLYSIDGPACPQQVLRLFSESLLRINGDFAGQISCGVVNNIYNIYLQCHNGKRFEDLNVFDSELWQEIRNISNKYELLSRIIKGNLYQDSYEYAALFSENAYLNGKLDEQSTKNASLLKRNTELETINEQQKAQIKVEKDSNESLIFETIKYLEELDREKSRNQDLQNENSSLQFTINGLKRFSNKFKFDQINEELKIDLLQIFAKNKNLNVTSCLKLIELLSGNRVFVHPDAYRSASEIDGIFVNCGRLLSQLSLLATAYFKEIQTNGEQQARKVFTPNEYASSESETIRNSNSPEVWSDRTITYNGKSQKLLRHLKISSNFNSKFTIRTYFLFDEDNKKIVIGYCGKHPKNTLS